MTKVDLAMASLMAVAAQANFQKAGHMCKQFSTINGVELKNLRKKYGLTQSEFSEKFGIPISTLRKWEQGVQKPSTTSISFLNKIAEAELV